MTDVSVRDSLLAYISDAHKDAYGFRPSSSWERYKEMSIEDLRKEADHLSEAVGEAIDLENQQKQVAIDRFEAMISKMMTDFGIDRETAIRWDIDAMDVGPYGMDYYAYKHGLPYNYFETAEAA